jgi:hypothetical protein
MCARVQGWAQGGVLAQDYYFKINRFSPAQDSVAVLALTFNRVRCARSTPVRPSVEPARPCRQVVTLADRAAFLVNATNDIAFVSGVSRSQVELLLPSGTGPLRVTAIVAPTEPGAAFLASSGRTARTRRLPSAAHARRCVRAVVLTLTTQAGQPNSAWRTVSARGPA